jgi:hypothetical protein
VEILKMGWFSHKKNNVLIKEANAIEFAKNALQLLGGNADPNANLHPSIVARIFTNQMKNEPNFNAAHVPQDLAGLKSYLEKISPPAMPSGGAGSMPIGEAGGMPIGGAESMPGGGVGSMPGGGAGDMPIGGAGSMPGGELGELGTEDEAEDIPEVEEGGLDLSNIPEFGGEEDVGEGGLDLGNLPEFGGMDISIGDIEPETEVAVRIKGKADAIAIEEEANDVPEEERADPYEDMQLDIGADDIEHVDRVNVEYISQKRFSIPTTYKMPDDNLKKLQTFIDNINKSKYSTGDSPVNIRFLTPPTDSRSNMPAEQRGLDEAEHGIPTSGNVPAKYLKEQTNRMGESVDIDYVDFVIDGELPNPEGNPMKKDPRGKNYPDKEVVYHIIGSVQLYNIEGFAPQEEKFITKEEADACTQRKNAEEVASASKSGLEEPERTWVTGKRLKSDPFEKLHEETKGWCWPSRYIGRWRTLVQKYPGSPEWDREYDSNTPLQCDHCNTYKRGGSARKSVYIAIEFPASDLWIGNKIGQDGEEIPKTGKQIKPTTLPGWDKYPQVWIGKKCVGGQADALKFLKNLETFKELMMGAEKTGRMSDSFGGSMQSSKGLPRIMSNYFQAGVGKKSWFSKNKNKDYSDIAVFKRYYFGGYRSEMYKASVAQHNWEKAKEKYDEDKIEHGEQSRIYNLLLEDWKRRGRRGSAPEKPVAPKFPGKRPPDPKKIPWGPASEENTKKANGIIKWWKDQQNGPLDNHNITDINYFGMDGVKTHNLITVAAAGEVDTHLFKHIPEMIKGYNAHIEAKRREGAEKADLFGKIPGRGSEDPFNARMDREQEQSSARAAAAERAAAEVERAAAERAAGEAAATARQDQIGAQGIELVDIAALDSYKNFKSELKYVRSQPTGTGTMHTLRDNDNNNYVFWDKHIAERRDPNPQYTALQAGEDYIMSGKKGKQGRRNTPLNNVKVIDLNAPEAPEGMVAQPGTIPAGNVVTEDARQENVGRQREDNTILNDTAPEAAPALTPARIEEMKKSIGKLVSRAKQVVITGRIQTQDEWGNLVPGKPMTPEELIPAFMGQVDKIGIPDFDAKWWVRRYQEILREDGASELLASLNSAPALWEEYFNETERLPQ